MFLDLLRKRRSVRQFEDRQVEQEKIDLLVEAMLRSPSSRSLNPWEFIFVTEKEKIAQLSKSKPHGAAFVKGAPLAIVILADPEKCDVWIEDCSIAATLIHLASTDIGLGSCWVQIRKRKYKNLSDAEEYVKNLLSVPKNLRVEAIVAVGYPQVVPEGHSFDSLPNGRINYEKYGERQD